jgi:hypothetical protein
MEQLEALTAAFANFAWGISLLIQQPRGMHILYSALIYL